VCLRFFIFHYFFPLFFVLDCDFWAHCEHFESGGGARRASGSAPFFFPPVCRGRVVLFFFNLFLGGIVNLADGNAGAAVGSALHPTELCLRALQAELT
jgi:hypothetical protein